MNTIISIILMVIFLIGGMFIGTVVWENTTEVQVNNTIEKIVTEPCQESQTLLAGDYDYSNACKDYMVNLSRTYYDAGYWNGRDSKTCGASVCASCECASPIEQTYSKCDLNKDNHIDLSDLGIWAGCIDKYESQ